MDNIPNVYISNRRSLTRKLATGDQQLSIDRNSKGNAQIYLQVPPTVPSFNTCPIISVDYDVDIKFETSATLNSDIETSCPIIVGTIPVRSVSFTAVPSAPPMDFPSSSGVIPSAPTMDIPPVASPSAPPMETPPPYPESNGATPFLPLPPSYEESINGVDGTTMDTENIEGQIILRRLLSTFIYSHLLHDILSILCNLSPPRKEDSSVNVQYHTAYE
ncbi:hypothetical protein NECAME_15422 [Necator americanus]|uniref:Arrestin C-terminal-like domain-containing protein n=1 Tax=Necator americanus TaxID=51031 RepID=W2SI06_NECAM|nr:hypothetical protein NECAME_15422 [Necator americanus]ETN69259.1 hypothetical protein NECAME_15422 [Necator americanus]